MDRKLLETVQRAQKGDLECVARVTEMASERVIRYLYRISLDHHAAEDLCQETMIRLLEYLPKIVIRDEGAFWAWLYRTAFSRLQQHHRDQLRRRRHCDMRSDPSLTAATATDDETPFEQVARSELARAVWKAIGVLKLHHRQILTLRCLESLSYAQIATITGGTQLQAKVRFFRARQSLRRQLLRQGLAKDHLLPALGVFAAVTAGSGKRAAGVASASLDVGVGVAVIGMAATKMGAAVLTAATVGALAVGSVVSSGAADSVVSTSRTGLSRYTIDRIEKRIEADARRFNFISAGFIYDANVAMTTSHGTRADLDKVLPLRGPNPITSTLCLQLLEGRTIADLDDPIAQYSRRFANCMPVRYADTPVTFRHLLAHTSGLPDSLGGGPLGRDGKLRLESKPGERYRRTEAGYVVLEMLLEEITGKRLDELIQIRIAAPIEATSFRALAPNDATVAGVECTITDLTRFLGRLLQGKYVSGGLLRVQVCSPQDSDSHGLGYSLIASARDGLSLVWDHGTWGLYDYHCAFQPCGRLGLVVVAQRKALDQFPGDYLQTLLDLLAILGEQHMQDRGGPHKPVWEIP
ncbi:MAG: sigma-70 family RNA polymerase sigma factor [Phycisphaerae bacterium]|nr:sigma-70 family RNA polymerase sigma factor [Phycisphaerae bacterium]